MSLLHGQSSIHLPLTDRHVYDELHRDFHVA